MYITFITRSSATADIACVERRISRLTLLMFQTAAVQRAQRHTGLTHYY